MANIVSAKLEATVKFTAETNMAFAWDWQNCCDTTRKQRTSGVPKRERVESGGLLPRRDK